MKTFLTFHENAYGPSFGQMIPVADLQAKFTQRDVDDVEKFADRILRKYDIDIEFTRHFIDRLNDPRNNPEIKIAELQRFFKKIQRAKGQNIRNNPDVELVLKDMSSNLNLPVVIKKRGDSFEVINKTIMRKPDFKTTSKVIRYEALKLKLLYPNKNSEMLVLNVVDTRGKGRVEVRGKRGYESGGYDKKDKLHKFLDKLDGATVAKLFADDEVVLNPNNTRTAPAIKAVKNLMNEEPRIPRKKGQPAGSKKHSDLYTDENPRGTIHGLKFATVKDAQQSVKKIEGSGKTHAHKVQAAVAMEQRAREMGKTAEANVYRAYIEKMKKKTKEMQKESPPDTSDAIKRYKAGKAGFTDIAHLKAKGVIKRADGTKRKSDKYK